MSDRSLIPLFTILLFGIFTAGRGRGKQSQVQFPIRIMSYNIKFDDKTDTVNNWDKRKKQVLNLISFYEPDFLGTQEVLVHQLRYLDQKLENMKWIGVGRADGDTEGEFSALFYNANEFDLIANSDSTIWLSKTPEIPSKSWDAALPRILTFGKFRHKQTGKELLVFNTHFDHRGDTARAESVKLILKTIDKVAGDLPVIVTGDFNFTEQDHPYSIITASDSPLKDAFYATAIPHVGPQVSFTGFTVDSSTQKRRIDYIFVNDKIEVLKHRIIANFQNGRYPSDHLPVFAVTKIAK